MATGIVASYKDYRKLQPKGQVDRQTYCKVVNEFNKFIMELLFEGHVVKLPEKLGTLLVKGKEVKPIFDPELGEITNQPVDWFETRKLWKRCPECEQKRQKVYYLNEHTNNVRYKIFWSRDKMIVGNKWFYQMIFTRSNKRKLAALIKGGKEFYIEPKKY